MRETNDMHVEIALGHEKFVFCMYVCVLSYWCAGNKDANKQAKQQAQQYTQMAAQERKPNERFALC